MLVDVDLVRVVGRSLGQRIGQVAVLPRIDAHGSPLVAWPEDARARRIRTGRGAPCRASYSISDIILNIGRYMAMMMTPTIAPTAIIMSGSMIEVRALIAASTSSS